jgi:ligand-binding SRPBCC domain-containing protein
VILRFEQVVAAPREALFAFHRTPANLGVLLEGWAGFELVEHEGRIDPGSRVSLRQAWGPWRFAMTFEHFVLDAPARFGERQVRGPFARFEHVHTFTPEGDGTRVVDDVDFASRWWLGGAVADRVVVAPTLRRFFEFRKQAYARLCAEGGWR